VYEDDGRNGFLFIVHLCSLGGGWSTLHRLWVSGTCEIDGKSLKHLRPVHLNRGQFGHVWLCLECGKQLRGPKLTVDEREVLIEFTKLLTEDKNQTKQGRFIMTTTQIVLNFEGSPSPLDIAARLRFQAGLWEGMNPKEAAARENTDQDEKAPVKKLSVTTTKKAAAPAVETDDDDFEPKKTVVTRNSASQGFDDDGDEAPVKAAPKSAAPDDDDDSDEAFNAPVAKEEKKKPAKLKLEDVIDACKVKAKSIGGKEGRDAVLAILQKKFKVTTVQALVAEQFADVIKAMKV
jgi:hypothetical protein